MAYSIKDIRNICLLGHSSSGKTLLAEALLQNAGAIQTMGTIERGGTVCDHDPQEKSYQHSLDSAVCHLDHGGIHVNLIDTPGFPDFFGRAVAVLPAVETAVIVVNAQTGVEMMTGRVMNAAKEQDLCRLIVVNRIDVPDTNIEDVLEQLQSAFGKECLPINLPAQEGSAVVDCFFSPSDEEVDFSSVEEAHTQIVEQVVEVNEELMEAYLEQGDDLDPEQLHNAFEQALREGHLIPVCFTSAKTGAGIPELLNIVERLMPNPMEGNPPHFYRGEVDDQERVEVRRDGEGHFIAHVFKISVDPFRGQLAIFRIHQGEINSNGQIFVGDARKPFKVSHLLKLMGATHSEIKTGIPGDICAVVKAEGISTNTVLHDSRDEDDYHMGNVATQTPMYGLAITPSRHGDEQRVSDVLSKMSAEDPCLRVEHIRQLNETVLRGMGELHLRVVLERMKEQYNVQVDTHPPSIAYRETISGKAEGHHRHKKQTGGAGQFGEVFLRIEPLERGGGFEFVDKVVGGVIPYQYIPAVEKGIVQVLENGAIAGYPIQDVKVTVYDGKHHSVDSKEIAFVQAGKKAFQEAVKNARPIILEPIVNVSIDAPSQFMGDINGDISTMRGTISGTNSLSNNRVEIQAQLPLKEVSSYHSRLKSITEGEGTYAMEFSHYARVPPNQQQDLVKAYNPREED